MRVLAFAVLSSGCLATHAATSGLDARFGTGGVVPIGATPTSGLRIQSIYGITETPDGKFLIVGRTPDPANLSVDVPAIGLLNSDGSWDTGFGDNGLFILPSSAPLISHGGELHTANVLSDGSVLSAGGRYDTTPFTFDACTLLVRLTASGVLDASFAPDQSGAFCFDFGSPAVTYARHAESVVVDADDSFFLTTPSTSLAGGAVAHFDATGALISAYGTAGVSALPTGVFATSLRRSPSGGLLASGIYQSVSNVYIASVQLDTKGQLDTGYGTAGICTTDAQPSFAQIVVMYSSVDANGRLLISSIGQVSGTAMPYRIARVDGSGTTDVTFNPSGQQSGQPGSAMLTQFGTSGYLLGAQSLPDGHILAVGESSTTSLILARLNADASFDGGYGDAATPGWSNSAFGSANTYARALVMDGRGRVLVSIALGQDFNGQGCPALVRIVADRLFDSDLENSPGSPVCP